MALVVGGLEAAEQLVRARQHLLGQLGRDDVLVLAAVGEDGRAAAAFGQAEEPLLAEQHVQGGEDRPAGHLGHLGDAEGGVAARLAARGVDQAEVRAVDQQADRDLGLAQQPLEPGLRGGLPVAVVGRGDLIELACRSGSTWISISHGMLGSFGSSSRTTCVGRSVSWYSGSVTSSGRVPRVAGRTGSRSPLRQPRTVLVNSAKSRISGIEFVVLVARQAGEEPLMVRGDVPVDVGLGGQQGRNRDDEADRLDVAEPFLMSEGFRVACHRAHPVTGQR